MDREEKILSEVDKTLRVMDDLKNLDGNPFIYTRIKSRLETQAYAAPSPWQKIAVLLRPIGLITLFLLNIYTAFCFINQGRSQTEVKTTDTSNILSKLSEKYSYDKNLYFFYNEGNEK